jgi:hypothetical protein
MATAMRRTAVLATVLALTFPAIAGATILINRGMFRLTLGDTMTQVQQKLGQPTTVTHRNGATLWFYLKQKLLLDFHGKNKPLHAIFTENPRQRTKSGVGVGSTQHDVMRLVPGVQCSTTPGQPGADCLVSATRNGKKYFTDFSIGGNGRVRNVLVDWLR